MTSSGSSTIPERLFACLPYLLPLSLSLSFGQSLFNLFPALQEILSILVLPVVLIYSILGPLGPFAGLILFVVLLYAVVYNPRIVYFVRFNTMQALLIAIAVFIASLLLGFLPGSLGLIRDTLNNTAFLAILLACGYALVQTLQGLYAEIPAISQATYLRVPR